MLASLLTLAVLLQTGPDTSALNGARNPAYAPNGRLAISLRGDLWVRTPAGAWHELTQGASVDHEPAWTPTSDSIVFSSDRSGRFSLWIVAASGGTPRQLTDTNASDGEPSVAPDGTIYFIRGLGTVGRLFARSRDGLEQRVTQHEDADSWPAISHTGALAYVTTNDGTGHLQYRELGDSSDTEITSARGLTHPTWSPDGTRIAYTTMDNGGQVLVTPTDGSYSNVVAQRDAEAAWSPDGMHLTLVERAPPDVSYNGDPNRLGDREAYNAFSTTGRMWTVDAPTPPGAGLAAARAVPVNRPARNATAFDEFFARQARLYYAGTDSGTRARRTAWNALRDRYRARAIAAPSDEALKSVLHDMLGARPPLRNAATGRAAVSSASPVATAAGLEILREGGNVVDAAVAVSFALAVAEPDASGPGGYGQMLIYQRDMKAPHNIGFMTRVPEDATLERLPKLPDERPALTNVPGTVAGMYLAWQQFGGHTLTWAQLLAPAIRAATDGYPVSDALATTLATERDQFLKSPAARKLFFRNGEPVHAGDTLKNPDLAWVLQQIADKGADGFYKGEVAQRMVDDLRKHGNLMRMPDMARYFAVDRQPVRGTYRGYTIYSPAPPVAGGAELVSTLNLLEHFPHPKPYPNDAATLNAMIQAWQLVPSTRGRIADPSLWPVDIQPFTSKDTADARWQCTDPTHALSREAIRGDSIACTHASGRTSMLDVQTPEKNRDPGRSTGTTAFTVGDANGNIVAVTQTLGTWGGTFYVTPGLGFLYNDKLGSYSSNPDSYGARLPYARHGSTIAPTIIFKGTGDHQVPFAAVGAAGNAWITAAIYQTIIGMIDDHLGPQAALELPRFLLSGGFGRGRGRGARGRATSEPATPPPVGIQMEGGFSPAVLDALRAMGYAPRLISLIGERREGYGAALKIQDGKVTAGADPRRAGTAGAIH